MNELIRLYRTSPCLTLYLVRHRISRLDQTLLAVFYFFSEMGVAAFIGRAVIYLWNLRFLPLKRRWRINRWKRWLLDPRSPLGLRYAVRLARQLQHPPQPHPCLFVSGLLWPPLPSWHFPTAIPPPPPPPLPREIMADPGLVSCQARDLVVLRAIRLWRWRDTPQRSFYRLYEAFCAADGPMITYETEYFWGRSEPRWAVARIDDPRCEDPEQYAVMAAVAEELAESFMWRLRLGLRRDDAPIMNRYVDPSPLVPETPPSWTSEVPGLQEKLILHPGEDEYFESPFHRRNIYAATGHFYTV